MDGPIDGVRCSEFFFCWVVFDSISISFKFWARTEIPIAGNVLASLLSSIFPSLD